MFVSICIGGQLLIEKMLKFYLRRSERSTEEGEALGIPPNAGPLVPMWPPWDWSIVQVA